MAEEEAQNQEQEQETSQEQGQEQEEEKQEQQQEEKQEASEKSKEEEKSEKKTEKKTAAKKTLADTEKKDDGKKDLKKEEEDGKGEKDKGEDDDADKEKHDYSALKLPELPEGVTSDTSVLDGVKAIGEKHNLPPDALQELVDFEAERIGKMQTSQAEEWIDQNIKWSEEIQNDKKLGGDNMEKSFKTAMEGVKLLFEKDDPALAYIFNESPGKKSDTTGLFNHPSFFRAFHKLGEMMKEGNQSISGETSQSEKRSKLDVLFGDKEQYMKHASSD